jgi:hypothetical protein
MSGHCIYLGRKLAMSLYVGIACVVLRQAPPRQSGVLQWWILVFSFALYCTRPII